MSEPTTPAEQPVPGLGKPMNVEIVWKGCALERTSLGLQNARNIASEAISIMSRNMDALDTHKDLDVESISHAQTLLKVAAEELNLLKAINIVGRQAVGS